MTTSGSAPTWYRYHASEMVAPQALCSHDRFTGLYTVRRIYNVDAEPEDVIDGWGFADDWIIFVNDENGSAVECRVVSFDPRRRSNRKSQVEVTYEGHDIGVMHTAEVEPSLDTQQVLIDLFGDGVVAGRGANRKTPVMTIVVVENYYAGLGGRQYVLRDLPTIFCTTNEEHWSSEHFDVEDGGGTTLWDSASWLYLVPEVVINRDFTYTIKHRFIRDNFFNPVETRTMSELSWWYTVKMPVLSVPGVVNYFWIGGEQKSFVYPQAGESYGSPPVSKPPWVNVLTFSNGYRLTTTPGP